MAFCSMDGDSALYDVTPVENMFIVEYMLKAPGDFVKVYLYALMQCYHPMAEMTCKAMAKDLELDPERVEAAFAYWERRGVLRRTGDNPVSFRFCNIKQKVSTQGQDLSAQLYTHGDLAAELQRLFPEKMLTYEQENLVYDWVDVLRISEEAVVMFLNDEKKRAGNRFSFRVADEKARAMAAQGIRSITDYEEYVNVTLQQEKELRRLLSRLGQRRAPSDDEKKLYLKWTGEWGFTPEAVQAACAETLKGTPSMAYLDGILNRQRQLGRLDRESMAEGMAREHTQRDFAKAVYERLGRTGRSPSEDDLRVLEELRTGTGEDMILLAAEAVHRHSGSGNLEKVADTIERWKAHGLTTVEAVRAEGARVGALNAQLKEIYLAAGMEKNTCAADRQTLCRWAGEMGMSQELILLAAEYARGSAAPFNLMNRMLGDWSRAGISTREAAQAEHAAHAVQNVPAKNGQTPQKDPMQRHDYTAEDYKKMVIDLDEEDF